METGEPYRFEIRMCFLHLPRFLQHLPIAVREKELADDQNRFALKRGWYRSLDNNLKIGGLRSYRFFSTGAWFLHPTNELKKDKLDFAMARSIALQP